MGKLFIEGEPYSQNVKTPKVQSFLDLDQSEVDKVLSLPTSRGNEMYEQSSTFIGYAADVCSTEEVSEIYSKVKLMHADASHVVCAYYLQGTEVADTGYCDDGEHGAGRALLNLLSANKMIAKATYVARYTDGNKMGNIRFQKYVQASVATIRAAPYNNIIQSTQELQHTDGSFRSANTSAGMYSDNEQAPDALRGPTLRGRQPANRYPARLRGQSRDNRRYGGRILHHGRGRGAHRITYILKQVTAKETSSTENPYSFHPPIDVSQRYENWEDYPTLDEARIRNYHV